MSENRWLYDVSGKARYYQTGTHLYNADTHQYEYYQSEKWYYTVGGQPAFYSSGKWLYTISGETAFYYG